jgi:hypothetical protein
LQVLDESGPILKTSLAKVTEAIAIDNLTSIVAGLGNVKRSLNDILKAVLRIRIRIRIHQIHMFLGLLDPSIIMEK